MKKLRTLQSGLSMVEVLVVIAIALPIIMAFMGAFNSVSKSQARNTDLERVQSTTMNIIHELTQEVHSAEEVQIQKGNQFDQLTLIKSGEKDTVNVYAVVQGQLLKNSIPFSQKELNVQLFRVENVAAENTVPLLHFMITVSSRRDEQVQLTQQFTLSLRQNRVQPTPEVTPNKLSF